jgi:hypothetical protein
MNLGTNSANIVRGRRLINKLKKNNRAKRNKKEQFDKFGGLTKQ